MNESTAFFSITGMNCPACAGSVEKAIKWRPGIREAVIDVLKARDRVQFYPSFDYREHSLVNNISSIMTHILLSEDAALPLVDLLLHNLVKGEKTTASLVWFTTFCQ